MTELLIVLLIIEAVLFFACWACPKCRHQWRIIAKDVCTGEGKRVNVYECYRCGKLKVE